MLVAGSEFQTNYGIVTVVEDKGWDKILVTFKDTGYSVITRRESIIKGSLKDPLKRVVYGVGYTGIGKYKITHRYAKLWVQMLRRCYSGSSVTKRPTYFGCTVADEWHNMQNFCAWCEKNWKKGFDLDKDIKGFPEKIYSADTCLFVSRKLNAIITTILSRPFCGVSKKGERYYVYVSENNKQRYIGSYASLGEARVAYLHKKSEVALSYTGLDLVVRTAVELFFQKITSLEVSSGS